MAKRAEPLPLSKDLVAASAATLVLAILTRGESYGYEILARVRELSGGKLSFKDGMLYPLLHRMEERGWIVASLRDSAEGRRRRYYRITKAGRQAMLAQREEWVFMHGLLQVAWS
jgi:DNA-binding PadR family transcriptional regulator